MWFHFYKIHYVLQDGMYLASLKEFGFIFSIAIQEESSNSKGTLILFS